MNSTGDDLPDVMRFLRGYLTNAFADLIDMGDLNTQCSAQEAAAAVTDGVDDHGIDAIAISPNGSDIWFVQAKWSDKGRAVLREDGALKLVAGLRRLANGNYEGVNAKINRLLTRIDEALSSPKCTVHLVAASSPTKRNNG
jgi:hypothetical protein